MLSSGLNALFTLLPVLTVKSPHPTAEETEAQGGAMIASITSIPQDSAKRVRRPTFLLRELVPAATYSDQNFPHLYQKRLGHQPLL